MSITSESLPYPTREISTNLPLFLSEIGAVAVPIPVTDTQTIVAIKGSTYITYGSGTITFTDPNILTSVSGDYYKVIVGGTSAAVIGGVTYNVASPIEILRLVSAGAWITYGGLNFSQISGTFTGNVIGDVTGNVSGSAASFTGNLAGQVTGPQSNTAISAATVTAKVLTGYASTTGTISAADTILSAIGKLNGNKAEAVLTDYYSTTGPISPTDTILSAIGKLNGNKAEAVVPIVTLSTTTKFNAASNGKIFHALTPYSGVHPFISYGLPDRSYLGVACSADGQKLIAIGDGGNSNLYASLDGGITWVESNAPSNYHAALASSADGTMCVAVGDGIYTSTDSGVTWVERIPSQSGAEWYLNSVASSADGTKLIAATSDGLIYTSTNSGVTWVPRISGATSLSGVASSADGTKLAVAGNKIYTSTDSGVTWVARIPTSSAFDSGIASSADGTKLVAASLTNGIWKSTDSGVTWTLSLQLNYRWTSITSSADGMKLAIGAYIPHEARISLDGGANWQVLDILGRINTLSIKLSADGTRVMFANDYVDEDTQDPFGSIEIAQVGGDDTTLLLPVASTLADGWSIGIVNVGGLPITVNRSPSINTNNDTINGTLTTFSNTVPYSAFYVYKSSSSTFVAIGVLY